MEIKKRKYNTNFRRYLNNKILNVKNREQLRCIYSIVVKDVGINRISKNNNGIFFNLNFLSDNAISQINDIISLCLT
jgi:hypothetical protein